MFWTFPPKFSSRFHSIFVPILSPSGVESHQQTQGGNLRRAARARELAHASVVHASPPGCRVRTATRHGTTAARQEETLAANAATISSSSSSNTRSTCVSCIFQENEEQRHRIANDMEDFARASLPSHSQPVPILFDESSTLSGRTSALTLSQPVIQSRGSSDERTSGIWRLQGLRKLNRQGRSWLRHRRHPPIDRRSRRR